MTYKYQPDPMLRRQERRARIQAHSDELFARLPQAMRESISIGPPPPSPQTMEGLAETLALLASMINVGDEPPPPVSVSDRHEELWELIADRGLEEADRAEEIANALSHEPKFRSSPYGNLGTELRLLVVRVRSGLRSIEDNVAAHHVRSFQPDKVETELSDEFWWKQFQPVKNDCFEDLRYLSFKIEAAADSEPPQPGTPADWLKVTEIALVMDISKADVSKYCASGKIQSIGDGASRRVNANSVVRFLLSRDKNGSE